jgi:hypothetical protein
VQCVSTAQYERAFSIQNCIKSKVCSKLQTKHLESIIRVAIEGPRDDIEYILGEAQALWRNSTKFRWLFSHPDTSRKTCPLRSTPVRLLSPATGW